MEVVADDGGAPDRKGGREKPRARKESLSGSISLEAGRTAEE